MSRPADLFDAREPKPAAKTAKPAAKRAPKAGPKRAGGLGAKGGASQSAERAASQSAKGAANKPAKSAAERNYTAKDIEVLEGLEPVRRRPGMYVGGTDARALHHLVAEVLDNSMDEAVAGHADLIEIELLADGAVSVTDNGRGIPIDPHPKIKGKTALEVILTTMHSGGKFSTKVYATSGGLNGVGVSVVNALTDRFTVEVARDRRLWVQNYSRGVAKGKLKDSGAVQNRRGTRIVFHPDAEIFGAESRFDPARLFRMARSKAYLFRGVRIRWVCEPSLIADGDATPANATLHFPGGLLEYLGTRLEGRATITPEAFSGSAALGNGDGRNGTAAKRQGRTPEDGTQADEAREAGRVEWAVAWPADGDGFLRSYCNTVPTPQGGSHESGMRTALVRGLKAYGEMIGNRRAKDIAADDLIEGACIMLSLFIDEPQFQGQTKERLGMPEALRLVDNTLKDHFDHWLSADPASAKALLERTLERAEARLARRQARELERKSATRRLRLPGKLSDCASRGPEGTELFLVEGDSAGGSAKQARRRATQAILPLRGKILNVASASADKIRTNQEIADLIQALGCGARDAYDASRLRYERVIIMTDADVDGAHIAALLMTFFYREMPDLIVGGHLYLAVPPLYRLSRGGEVRYARDDAHREALMAEVFAGRSKVEVSRFKGLGEMPPKQLKTTTMDPTSRTLLQVTLPDAADADARASAGATAALVDALMGRKPELRLAFIQERAGGFDGLDF